MPTNFASRYLLYINFPPPVIRKLQGLQMTWRKFGSQSEYLGTGADEGILIWQPREALTAVGIYMQALLCRCLTNLLKIVKMQKEASNKEDKYLILQLLCYLPFSLNFDCTYSVDLLDFIPIQTYHHTPEQ